MSKTLYPGSFDPITLGHMNVIEQATNIFDEVYIAIMHNPNKNNLMFTVEERLAMIKELYQSYQNIKVVSSEGLTIDLAQKLKCNSILRGIRNFTDYDYENQLATINNDLSNKRIRTVCVFADPEYQVVSSSMIKQVVELDRDITKYVDPLIKNKILVKVKGDNK